VATVFPQPRLPNGCRLDDAIGHRFAVIVDPSVSARMEGNNRASLDCADVVIIDDYGADIAIWLEDAKACAVVLRPDRYVFGVAASASELADLAGVLSAIT
jgi:3-(3-hydroxy-phenyl)propionate hydroxylase